MKQMTVNLTLNQRLLQSRQMLHSDIAIFHLT